MCMGVFVVHIVRNNWLWKCCLLINFLLRWLYHIERCLLTWNNYITVAYFNKMYDIPFIYLLQVTFDLQKRHSSSLWSGNVFWQISNNVYSIKDHWQINWRVKIFIKRHILVIQFFTYFSHVFHDFLKKE